MSIGTWYLHKATQCVRLAADASDLGQRAKFEEEAVQWRAIAREIARQDRLIATP